MADRVDAVVVGAGPAGSMAALSLARAGRSVVLVERGPFPGSKNLYGGVVYGRILDTLVPGWTETAPIERWVTRRVTMLLTGDQSFALDFRSQRWAAPPYNGATALRPTFDRWLADQAVAAGAQLVCSTTVTGLIRDGSGRVTGVRTDRPGGEIGAGVVIACDGVNAFLAEEAGLAKPKSSGNYALGVKEVLALDPAEIERRFQLQPGEGADFEVLGGTGGVSGGGFLYTNSATIAVGLVLSLDSLTASGRRPESLLAEFKAHPSIAPLVADGELVEYGAHLIPEAGWSMMPELVGDGILVAGDAAGLCLAAGIWLEGVNFALASGAAAGEAAAAALGEGDTSRRALRRYRAALESSFVLADHRRLRNAPHLLFTDRMQREYPQLLCDVVEELFTVRNPAPKPGLIRLARNRAKASGVKLSALARDTASLLRIYG